MSNEALKLEVWNSATIAYGYDPDLWRYDSAGLPMYWPDYLDTLSIYGWHIAGTASEDSKPSDLSAVHWQTLRSSQSALQPGDVQNNPTIDFTCPMPAIPAYIW